MDPVVWDGASWPFNLGRFGFLLASHLCHMRFELLLHHAERKGNQKFIGSMNTFLDCLGNKSTRLPYGHDTIPREVKIRLAADIVALGVINRVFDDIFSLDDSVLPDSMADIPARHLMYISLAQTHCRIKNLGGISGFENLPDFHRAILPLMHDQVFADIHKCPEGSRMTGSVDRCILK